MRDCNLSPTFRMGGWWSNTLSSLFPPLICLTLIKFLTIGIKAWLMFSRFLFSFVHNPGSTIKVCFPNPRARNTRTSIISICLLFFFLYHLLFSLHTLVDKSRFLEGPFRGPSVCVCLLPEPTRQHNWDTYSCSFVVVFLGLRPIQASNSWWKPCIYICMYVCMFVPIVTHRDGVDCVLLVLF